MNQKEVVHTLLIQAKIEPGFTELGNLFVIIFCHLYHSDNILYLFVDLHNRGILLKAFMELKFWIFIFQ